MLAEAPTSQPTTATSRYLLTYKMAVNIIVEITNYIIILQRHGANESITVLKHFLPAA
jgi:hypothetical protein